MTLGQRLGTSRALLQDVSGVPLDGVRKPHHSTVVTSVGLEIPVFRVQPVRCRSNHDVLHLMALAREFEAHSSCSIAQTDETRRFDNATTDLSINIDNENFKLSSMYAKCLWSLQVVPLDSSQLAIVTGKVRHKPKIILPCSFAQRLIQR
ncbi:hypothetical protein PoB_005727300 [Plakobranchus ocellatus]|uniref:Uncharacterized protein n=1 Tax=Plakobranchus ocellatus TaxID=259542 RepID=A0AAV4CGT7_9GAST|nr:hypothetical protein PoB_005727300 [Plakobranchus ocellatus]